MDAQRRVANYIISLVDISAHKQLEERLRYLSERDELSQLWNRRKFEQELYSETLLVERYPQNHQGCLALLDIDNFKRVNDTLGHDAGDKVIKLVSEQLLASTRKTDFVARIGGEEFAILLRHTTLLDAEVILNRLRETIAQDTEINATISLGVTDLTTDGTRSYKCADIALYESKSSGRNQTTVCSSSDDIA
jgi:diguanylate cyclase (GGDEF)-like protein